MTLHDEIAAANNLFLDAAGFADELEHLPGGVATNPASTFLGVVDWVTHGLGKTQTWKRKGHGKTKEFDALIEFATGIEIRGGHDRVSVPDPDNNAERIVLTFVEMAERDEAMQLWVCKKSQVREPSRKDYRGKFS